jgi:hypothetical protein
MLGLVTIGPHAASAVRADGAILRIPVAPAPSTPLPTPLARAQAVAAKPKVPNSGPGRYVLARGQVSCQNGSHIVLNAKRWVFGAETYGTDVGNYRRYLVNHEFGHALGYQHTLCAGQGQRAGIMMQQTKGLDGCRPNPWPYPN